MKKLMIVCMLAAIGAVGMIEKSNAAPGDCGFPGSCGGGGMGGMHGMPHMQGGPNMHHFNPGQQGNFNGGNPPWKHKFPNGQANNGNWPHYHNNHWNNGGAYFGFGLGDPYYYDDPYYGSYGYAEPYPYAYRSYSGSATGRCDAWAGRLRSAGYHNVRATDCAGTSYVYRATKAGKPVKVTVRASSGSIIRVASAY